MIITEDAEYEIIGDGLAALCKITRFHDHFIVPSVVISKDQEYKIINVLDEVIYLDSPQPIIISFDESSEIEEIPDSFVFSCISEFYLPSRIKRIRKRSDGGISIYHEASIYCSNNKFVSVLGKKLL